MKNNVLQFKPFNYDMGFIYHKDLGYVTSCDNKDKEDILNDLGRGCKYYWIGDYSHLSFITFDRLIDYLKNTYNIYNKLEVLLNRNETFIMNYLESRGY